MIGLESFAQHAVLTELSEELSRDSPLAFEAARIAIHLAEGLSLQREEGKRITGVVVIPTEGTSHITVGLGDFPGAHETKLLGKLMLAAGTRHEMEVCPRPQLLGYRPRSTKEARAPTDIGVELTATGEALVFVGPDTHASCKVGRFHGSCLELELEDVERQIRAFAKEKRWGLDPSQFSKLLAAAPEGCGLIFAGDSATDFVEHGFATNPLSLADEDQLEMVAAMSAVDGALLFDQLGYLLAFGCILDGPADSGRQVRSRGARFNSAIRFTSNKDGVLAVVRSSDGPVSLIHSGELVYPKEDYLRVVQRYPPNLGADRGDGPVNYVSVSNFGLT